MGRSLLSCTAFEKLRAGGRQAGSGGDRQEAGWGGGVEEGGGGGGRGGRAGRRKYLREATWAHAHTARALWHWDRPFSPT